MNPTSRMRRALDQLETHRVELERAIVADIESRFFSSPAPVIEHMVTHLGVGGSGAGGDITTVGNAFSIAWFE